MSELISVLIIISLLAVDMNTRVAMLNVRLWEFAVRHKLPITVPYIILKVCDGISTWIHEVCHYLTIIIFAFPLVVLSVDLPKVSYWQLNMKSDGSREGLCPPAESKVGMTMMRPRNGYLMRQRISLIFVKLAPIAIPIVLVLLLPIWQQILIHFFTCGSLFPSADDVRCAIGYMKSDDVTTNTDKLSGGL